VLKNNFGIDLWVKVQINRSLRPQAAANGATAIWRIGTEFHYQMPAQVYAVKDQAVL
jgi:hypothetical protein